MIHTSFILAPVAAFALGLSLYRRDVRPVAAALCALAGVDLARHYAAPLPRVDASLWVAWACIQGAFAWLAWKDEGPRCGQASRSPSVRGGVPRVFYAITFALPALPFLPVHWSPLTWNALLVAPHWAAAAVGLAAWSGARPRTVAQAVALVLTWSGALDVVIGALAPGAGWVRAAPLAWATWGVVGAVLAGTLRRA